MEDGGWRNRIRKVRPRFLFMTGSSEIGRLDES